MKSLERRDLKNLMGGIVTPDGGNACFKNLSPNCQVHDVNTNTTYTGKCGYSGADGICKCMGTPLGNYQTSNGQYSCTLNYRTGSSSQKDSV
jgi:hypothetical protein